MQHDGELQYYKDMAQYVKRELEEQFKDSWHVIVGTNFGSFVTYEHKSIILFWLEHIGFLLFKHGWAIQINQTNMSTEYSTLQPFKQFELLEVILIIINLNNSEIRVNNNLIASD